MNDGIAKIPIIDDIWSNLETCASFLDTKNLTILTLLIISFKINSWNILKWVIFYNYAINSFCDCMELLSTVLKFLSICCTILFPAQTSDSQKPAEACERSQQGRVSSPYDQQWSSGKLYVFFILWIVLYIFWKLIFQSDGRHFEKKSVTQKEQTEVQKKLDDLRNLDYVKHKLNEEKKVILSQLLDFYANIAFMEHNLFKTFFLFIFNVPAYLIEFTNRTPKDSRKRAWMFLKLIISISRRSPLSNRNSISRTSRPPLLLELTRFSWMMRKRVRFSKLFFWQNALFIFQPRNSTRSSTSTLAPVWSAGRPTAWRRRISPIRRSLEPRIRIALK